MIQCKKVVEVFMLKIYAEDLVVNSLINLYEEKKINQVEEHQLLKYKEALRDLLKQNGIDSLIKFDEESYKKLEDNKYVELLNINQKRVYRMRQNINYVDLLEVRSGLPEELINILEDDTLKESLGIIKEDKKEQKVLRKIG